MTELKTGLALLREPFEPHHVKQLPKGTKAQNNCKSEDKKNCNICGGWHHPKIKHLSYVGHAALTDRLLDADPEWYWEPMAFIDGLPAFDKTGGLWIRLFVGGHSRIGYGHAEESTYKEIGSREKEVIGDAMRNAAMRFGAALDLWHKGDLHLDDDGGDGGGQDNNQKTKPKDQGPSVEGSTKLFNEMYLEIDKCTESTTMAKWFAENAERIATGLNDNDKTRLRALYKEYSEIFKKERKG